MKFSQKLIKGKLIQRYKRFLADVELQDGSVITAHCANPGAMEGLKDPGITVFLSKSCNPKRKLAHSWELAQIECYGRSTLVGINTAHPNRLALEAIESGAIAQLAGYDDARREVRYGENSRIDILLDGKDRRLCYVEVKNVHLCRSQGLAEFPDSVTKRGTKHLAELAKMVEQGHRAVMLYVIQRDDCDCFTIAADKDPAYGAAFAKARARGVEMLAFACALSPEALKIEKKIELIDPVTI